MSGATEAIYQAVVEMDRKAVEKEVTQALEAGIKAEVILNDGLIAAMKEVGRLFEEGEYFVPEMLMAAKAMQAAMTILRPRLVEEDIQPVGKVVIGTVKGDLHDIGKNLVAMMLEGAGFQIIDLGTDVAPEKFVEAIHQHHPDILGMSALITTTMPGMGRTLQSLRDAGVRDQVTVLVGGAPVTAKFASEIGADGYAPDASQAAALARQLVQL